MENKISFDIGEEIISKLKQIIKIIEDKRKENAKECTHTSCN